MFGWPLIALLASYADAVAPGISYLAHAQAMLNVHGPSVEDCAAGEKVLHPNVHVFNLPVDDAASCARADLLVRCDYFDAHFANLQVLKIVFLDTSELCLREGASIPCKPSRLVGNMNHDGTWDGDGGIHAA